MQNTIYLNLKKAGAILLLLFVSLAQIQAEDLPGYQKLRGDIISSPTLPTEHNGVPIYYHKYNAFDTNLSTTYISADLEGWIGLDLKTACPIKKVRIYPTYNRPERVLGTIQGASSPDFSDAVDLHDIFIAPLPGQFTTYDITSDQAFRYVRLIAYAHQECSLVEIEFYTTPDTQPNNYVQLTNLPTVYIETKGQFDFVNKGDYKISNIVVVNNDSPKSYLAEVRGRGNSTWEFMEKKPIRIKFDKKQRFLGHSANAKSWALLANYTDKSMIRNGLAFEMSKFMEFEWTPSCIYADVVLDGFYYGTFAVCDQVQIHEDRINIDEMTPNDISGIDLTGGYHLELDAYAHQEPVHFHTSKGIPFTVKNPEDECQPEQLNYIREHIQKLEDLLYFNPQEAIEQYIDLESAVRYYLHSELTGNCDAYWCIPCYKKKGDDKLYFGPVWDFDQAFLNNWRVPINVATLDTGHGTAQPWFRIIMDQPEAKALLKKEWKKIKEQNLQQILFDYIDNQTEYLHDSQNLNYQRWDCLDKHVWFDDFQFETIGEYMEFIKMFLEFRINWYEERMGDLLSDDHHFLVASKPYNESTQWKYLISEDYSDSWFEEQYDDTEWEEGLAPFGTEQNLQNTLWDSPGTILIRTHFNVEEDAYDRINELYISVFHDEDCWIYINGEFVMELEGYNHGWDNFPLDKQHIRPGENLIAIKCVQTAGGQLIDAGIFAKLEPIEEEEEEEEDTSLNNTKQSEYTYTIRESRLLINNLAPNTSMSMYSLDGRLIKQLTTNNSELEINLPSKGIYLLKINNETLKIKN